MGRPHLIIVCGVPGAGKSTFAVRAVDSWGAVSFASEAFAEELGPAARSASGDLSKEAIVHAYAAMCEAAAAALQRSRLVVAVGSFRADEQRRRFRKLALDRNAAVTTVRISCPVALAAERVRARIALGERGPGVDAIRQIDAELDRARDIDAVLHNQNALGDFHLRIDRLIEALEQASGPNAPAATIRLIANATADEPLRAEGTAAQTAQMKGN